MSTPAQRAVISLAGLLSLIGSSGAIHGQEAAPKYPPFADVMKEAEKIEGLLPLYRKGEQLYGEIGGGVLNRDLIVLPSIARGIGFGDVLGGMSLEFGNDWLWQFRKVGENVHIVRRNIRFTAASGTPTEEAVKLAYTDSVLYSLPVVTMAPSGGMIVDLTQVFMSDLPQIARMLPGFMFASNKSTWGTIKGFEQNMEIEVAATYASAGMFEIETLPDSHGATVNLHYSISLLPQTGYRPRLADDRVGYFLTVIKDYSKNPDQEHFVRYINRWDLQKADPSAEKSPPKQPIIFWLENTVPFEYRKPIRDGILEWNKAFEAAGFLNAVEVRQQPDADDPGFKDFDPENIQYNTFRWITTGAGFAMGPSRVNPTSGQILDADIIFDSDFIAFWKTEYETFTPETVAQLTGGPFELEEYRVAQERLPAHLRHTSGRRCDLHRGMSLELAFGSSVLMVREATPEADMQKLIMQGLKEVTMHEVGHTLGLRHNFKASSWLTLADLNNTEKTKETGLTASVMDYGPTNIMPKGAPQGDYYSTTVGPYDMWAIQYGYSPLSGGSPEGEMGELAKISSRSAEPGLAFATDEDARGIDPDPATNLWDLGNDPMEYAQARTKLISELWPEMVQKVTKDGEGYQKARQAFGVMLGQQGRASTFVARVVGGVHTNRDHKGDANGRAPVITISAEKQRAAMAFLEENVFSDKPYQFPPELYNYLASSRWNHWGTSLGDRPDYPAHEVINMFQDQALARLLSSLTLTRIHDTELKVASDQDAFTAAELLERLTKATFRELDEIKPSEYTNRRPAVSSIRRNLQRSYLVRMSDLAMGNTFAPEDCETLAYMELTNLEAKIRQVLASGVNLDSYSKAHLIESADRIHKVLDARLQLYSP